KAQPAETKKPAAAGQAARPRKKRQSFAEGHKRKLLVVVDETPECESALAFAASRAQRTGGQLSLLYVIEPDGDFQWLAVGCVSRAGRPNMTRRPWRAGRATTRPGPCSACSAESSKPWVLRSSCRKRWCAKASRPRRSRS